MINKQKRKLRKIIYLKMKKKNGRKNVTHFTIFKNLSSCVF